MARSKRRRLLVALIPAVAFVVLLAYGLLRSAPANVGEGSVAPDFKLPVLGGSQTLSSEELKGCPVVLNFWASWCIPCKEEAPLLERTWRAYKDDGIAFVGVNIKDSVTDAKKFVERFSITYPIVRDESEQLARKLSVFGIPETYFIDDNWRFIGSVSGDSRGERQGTVVLGAIADDLVTNIEILLRRAEGTSRSNLGRRRWWAAHRDGQKRGSW